jgi:excisionase family DNA binding protein
LYHRRATRTGVTGKQSMARTPLRTSAVASGQQSERRGLVDVAGLAHYLGITVRHVRRLVNERRVPFHKIGHLVRFDLDAIDAWLADHRSGPDGDRPAA